MKLYYLCAVGCSRRKIDAQKICNYFEANGYGSTMNYENADVIVISTCAFIKTREDISLDAIEFYRNKKKDTADLVVAGCLSKISPEIIKKYDDIAFVSPRDLDKLDELIDAKITFGNIPDPNIISSHPLFPNAPSEKKGKKKNKLNVRPDLNYNKSDLFNIRIAKGCLGNCSYCAIKLAAGRLESKPIPDIVEEFRHGLKQGYKKFILIAGDTGCYGVDIGTTVVDLLTEIFRIDGSYKLIIKEFNAQWVIKYYEELCEIFRNHSHKIDYMIVPVQSGSDKILRLMNRPYRVERVKDCLLGLKMNCRDPVITTHLMVGFPGETEEDFQQSVNFIKGLKFPYVEIYGYDERPNTQASGLANPVSREEMDRRIKILRETQETLLGPNMKGVVE